MKTAYYKITLFLFIIAAIFVARLVYLQLLTDRYALNAANTSIKIDYVIPQRGIIFDRNGKILVGNQPSYEISFTQSQMTPDFDTLGFCNLGCHPSSRIQIHLPVDVVAADAFSNDANTQVVDVKNIPDGWQGLDAGPKSLEIIKRIILDSKTILWNGPLGVFEMESFANGTISLGEYIAESTANGAFSLVGGGDSVAAVKQFGLEPKMSYVSTGGGAMLEMLEGRTLPGIAAILD